MGIGKDFLLAAPKTSQTFVALVLVSHGQCHTLSIRFSFPLILWMIESIVTDPLSIHKIANTSLTTTLENVSQSNFFFYFKNLGKISTICLNCSTCSNFIIT